MCAGYAKDVRSSELQDIGDIGETCAPLRMSTSVRLFHKQDYQEDLNALAYLRHEFDIICSTDNGTCIYSLFIILHLFQEAFLDQLRRLPQSG